MKNEFIAELKRLNLEPMSGEAFLKFMSENELIKEFRAKSGGKIGECLGYKLNELIDNKRGKR